MKQLFKQAFDIIKKQDIEACIAGSYMTGYHEKWGQDIDIFCYTESSFRKLIFFMYYDKRFTVLDKLEEHKLLEYINTNKSSYDTIGLITIKFYYNLSVPVNIILKKSQRNLFDVISNFDIDLIAVGYDIKTGKTLNLRESVGKNVTWNRWNKSFYQIDFWSTKRLLRQFQRIIKYTDRGYNLNEVTDKYISILKEIIKIENFYHTEKGKTYFNENIEQFKKVLAILKVYRKEGVISKESLDVLNTLI